MSDEITRFKGNSMQYAAGKLDPEEARWMENMLAINPELESVVVEDRLLLSLARAEMPPVKTGLVSFEMVLAALQAEQAKSVNAARRNRWFLQPASNAARWVALASLLLATGITWQLRASYLPQVASDGGFRSLSPTQVQRPVLVVRFSDDLLLGKMQSELARMGMVIVGGPGIGASYRIAGTGISTADMMTKLKHNPLAPYIVSIEEDHLGQNAD